MSTQVTFLSSEASVWGCTSKVPEDFPSLLPKPVGTLIYQQSQNIYYHNHEKTTRIWSNDFRENRAVLTKSLVKLHNKRHFLSPAPWSSNRRKQSAVHLFTTNTISDVCIKRSSQSIGTQRTRVKGSVWIEVTCCCQVSVTGVLENSLKQQDVGVNRQQTLQAHASSQSGQDLRGLRDPQRKHRAYTKTVRGKKRQRSIKCQGLQQYYNQVLEFQNRVCPPLLHSSWNGL